MESIGLMPSSTGKPGGAKTGESMADYPIDDGKFMQMATELMNGGFGISWLDRLPIRVNSNFPQQTMQIDNFVNPITTLSENDLSHFLIEQKTNKSNRLKYFCDSCGNQVWGKPGLKLLCGEENCHNNPLTAEE